MSYIMNLFSDPYELVMLLFRIPIILIALSIHEASHGFAAYKCGDPTARNLGRLTLNPIRHLDPIGTVCMLLFGIGWAKPVPVNTRYFKNPRNGMAITACAGPLSNVIMSFLGIILFSLIACLINPESTVLLLIGFFFYYFHLVNLMLGLFNLIPIPPLDGSRIAFIFLPDKIYFGIMKYEEIIKIIFLAFLFFSGASLIGDLAYFISNGALNLIVKIPGFDAYEINTFFVSFYNIFVGNGNTLV